MVQRFVASMTTPKSGDRPNKAGLGGPAALNQQGDEGRVILLQAVAARPSA
jgi:hypothetical protein